jgi:hypothetical protein
MELRNLLILTAILAFAGPWIARRSFGPRVARTVAIAIVTALLGACVYFFLHQSEGHGAGVLAFLIVVAITVIATISGYFAQRLLCFDSTPDTHNFLSGQGLISWWHITLMHSRLLLTTVIALCSSGCRSSEIANRILSPLKSGVFHITPRTELTHQGPVGTGNARCGLAVYAWEHQRHCTVQVNHCTAGESFGSVRCLSLADERTVACGATFDACGQTVQCDCPQGDASPVTDQPGTVHVTRTTGTVTSSDGTCVARANVPEWARNGPAPAPCILEVQTREGSTWNTTTQMLSCGVRTFVCAHPVVCDCPEDR